MPEFSRRWFISRTSWGVAAAGVLSAVPGLSSVATDVESEAPGVGSATLTQPLVANVTNLQTGEISIFSGEQEINIRDPQLAARLFHAAQ